MKIFQRLCLMICAGVLSAQVSAQSYEQVHLSDGSVLEGFICEQVPGSSVSVRVSKATYVAASDSLQSSSERKVPVKDLPSDAWRSWVMAQPNAIEKVALSNLKFDNTEFRNVLVLENGPMIRFLSLDNTTRTFPMENVVKIVREPMEKNVFSGLKDVVTLDNGTRFSGRIVEQVPGKTIKIAIDDISSATVNVANVVSMQSVPITSELTVLEQAPLLDRVYIEGSSKPVEGVITLRSMADNPTVAIVTKNGRQSIPMENVTKYCKVKNNNVVVLRDREMTPGAVLLNGKDAWFAQLQEQNGYFILDENASMVAKPGDKITVEANLENPDASIYLIRAYSEYIPDPMSKETLKRDVFKYRDLVERTLPYQRKSTPLGHVKVDFAVHEPGDYILFLQGKPGYIIIHVEGDNFPA